MKFYLPCTLSILGHFKLGRHSHRTNGHVIGESRDKTCWWVSWDGHTPQSYAKVFIELITLQYSSDTNNRSGGHPARPEGEA